MNKLYVFCRRIHRLLAILIISLGLAMTVSGLMLKYPAEAAQLFRGIDLSLIRYLHNQLSIIFAIAFISMSFTGSILFLYPKWIQGRSRSASDSIDNN